jgi:hypothetical protein
VLKLDEVTAPDGTLASVRLDARDGALLVTSGDETLLVPEDALAAIMRRYGAAFDPSEKVSIVATLSFESGEVLRHVRHLARFDVIARDYVVYDAPGGEPLCALAKTVAAALQYVGRSIAGGARARARSRPEPDDLAC